MTPIDTDAPAIKEETSMKSEIIIIFIIFWCTGLDPQRIGAAAEPPMES